MNILLAAATPIEIQTTREYLAEKMYYRKDFNISILITGVGLVNTTYTLLKYFNKNRPDVVIQAGIGGTLHPLFPPGSVVLVKEELIGDLGVEENDGFYDVFDLKLADENAFPFSAKLLKNPHQKIWEAIKLPRVRAVSVNEITTGALRIQQLIEKYGIVIESMEGAALHYVCLQEAIPFIQLRSVSNFAGERDKTKWQISDAISSLNRELIEIMHHLMS
ncbi:MAG TPA: futalosine hydrolase [Agriterribacter sp.]|nr:futalosine hydrolase [Agriterribacter sp.]